MKKILLAILTILIIYTTAYAKDTKDYLSDVISSSPVDKNQIAISIKDADSGKIIYQLNEKMLISPASVQKMLTIIPIIDSLGNEYNYETKLYSNNDNTIYHIKLGADPYLKTSDLKKMVKNISPDVKKILIDDSIIENKDWGEGWQWDDMFNPLMPRFNSYNLDDNRIKLSLIPIEDEKKVHIINSSGYPLAIINNLVNGEKNSYKLSREKTFADNMIKVEGEINTQNSVYIPTENLCRYFNIKLNKLLEERNIYLKEDFTTAQLKDDYHYVSEITHPINTAIKDILRNSNNTVSETSLKLAGGVSFNTTGTDLNGIELFHSYCKNIGLDTADIKITDASGVSKNNLLNADFITEFLLKNKDNEIYKLLPAPGEGTLANRLLFLKENLKAKTGTLSNISTIAGFLKTKNDNNLIFCIMSNSPNVTASKLKVLEDYLIRELYLRF